MASIPTLLLALGGLAFLAVGWRIRRADITSASWLPVSAAVLSSDIIPQEGGFTPSVSYRYTIGGQTLVCSDIALTLVSTSSEASARAAASRYPVGSTVTAFINPKNHSQAILEPSLNSPLAIAFLAAGLLLLCMSLYRVLASVQTPQ